MLSQFKRQANCSYWELKAKLKVKYFKNTFSKNKKPTDHWKIQLLGQTEIPNNCWERLWNMVSKPFLRTGSWSLLALPKQGLITGHSTPDAVMGEAHPGFLRLGSMAVSIPNQCLLVFESHPLALFLLSPNPTALRPLRYQSLYFLA